jgi:hypothetical protein
MMKKDYVSNLAGIEIDIQLKDDTLIAPEKRYEIVDFKLE